MRQKRASASSDTEVALRAMLSAAQQRGSDVAQEPRRLPGEPNPEGNGDAGAHVAREAWMTQSGAGTGDVGIGRALSAMFDWWARRTTRRGR